MTKRTTSPMLAHLLLTTAMCGTMADFSPPPVTTPFTSYMKSLDASLASGRAVVQ